MVVLLLFFKSFLLCSNCVICVEEHSLKLTCLFFIIFECYSFQNDQTMKKKSSFLIFFFLLVAILSCDKETIRMYIFIENNTNKNIEVILFPKAEYLSTDGNMYCFESNGSGYNPCTFELGYDSLNQITNYHLFISDNIGLSATELLNTVFDSIWVNVPSDGDSVHLSFSPKGASGYIQNMFVEDSAWEYEIVNNEYPTNLRVSYETAHSYTFGISMEN